MSQIDDFLSGKLTPEAPQSIDDFLGIKPKKKRGAGDVAADLAKGFGGAAVSAVGAVPTAVGRAVQEGGEMLFGLSMDEARRLAEAEGTPEKALDWYEKANRFNPVSAAGRGIESAGRWISDQGDSLRGARSEEAKEMARQSTPDGDITKPSTWTMGENPSVEGVAQVAADVVGSMAPPVATAIATRGRSAATQMRAGGAAVAGQIGGAAMDEASQYLGQFDDNQLRQVSPVFRDLEAKGYSAADARTILEREAQNRAASYAAPVGFVGGQATGALLGKPGEKLAGKFAGMAPKAIVLGVLGASEEGLQEVSEGVATRAGINDAAGTDRSLTEGTFGEFVLGAKGGGVTGAGKGALEGFSQRGRPAPAEEPAVTPPNQPVTPPNQPVTPPNRSADPTARLAELEILAEQRDLTPAERQEAVDLLTALSQQDEQDAPQGTEPEAAEAAPVEAAAPEGSNGAAAAGVSDEGSGYAVEAAGVEAASQPAQPELDVTGRPPSSWVVRNKETGEVLFETFDPAKVRALNTAKYEAVPIGQHLASFNKPTDFWSFAKSKGYTPGQIRVGTPEHAALKAEYDALKSPEPVLPPMQPPQNVDLQNRDRGRAASVVQMADIARNPDYMRLGPSRTPDSGAPMVFAVGDQINIDPQAFGRQDVAVMSDGQRVPFRYAVVDASRVNPSNFADGRQNPEFNSTTPGTLKALNNGRTAGVRAAHEMGTAGEYVSGLQADEAMHGIPADVIARVPNPMLVRVYSDAENTAGMAAKSQGQGLGMSPAELARQDAPLMDSSVLSVYQPGDVTSAGNRDFVRAFMGKLTQAGQDVAGMMTGDGQLSQDGRKRIQAALMQAAYGDSDIVEEMFDSTDTDIKAIGEALKTVAGQWANMRDSAKLGAINPQTDITDNLLQAIGLIRKARRDNTMVYDLVQQPDLMTGETPDATTVGVLRMFYTGNYMTRAVGKDRLTKNLGDYITAAMVTTADAGMFGDVVTPGEILATIEPVTEGQGNAETQPQEGGGQPTGGDVAGVGADAVQQGDGGPGADEGRAGAGEDSRSQPREDAQAEAQQQVGAGDQAAEESNGTAAERADAGQQEDSDKPAAPARGRARKAKGEGVKAPTRTLNEDGRASDGKAINPGDVFATLSGRNTTGYPKQKGEKYASQWLINNALMEAEARGDSFNASTFSNTKPLKDGTLATADRESMLMYLFGQQPDVAPSILKPLTGRADAASAAAPLLTAPTAVEVVARQDAAEAAQREAEAADRKAAEEERKRQEREEIRRRSEAAADTFELGQDPMDNLSGQQPMFSRAKAKEIRNLVTLHNLTEANLEYADSMGGLPVPSLGISKVDAPFSGFGNITLVGDKNLVDPGQGVPVYDRDAWTARFPEMNYKKVKAAKADAFYERMKPAKDLADDGGQFLSMLWDEMRNASVQSPDKIADLFTRYDAPKVYYLRNVLEKNFKVPMRDYKPSVELAADSKVMAYYKANRAAVEGFDSVSAEDHAKALREFEALVNDAVDRVAAKAGDRAELRARMMRQAYFEDDGRLGGSTLRAIFRDIPKVGTKVVDGVKMMDAINKAVPRNDPAYLKWVQNQVKPLFDAPTITLRGKEVAPTLDNIVEAMTVGATAGVEKSMTFGAGKLAAHLGKRFKSLEEIKAARDQVVSESVESEAKKATDAILEEFRTHVAQFFTFKDWRGNVDTWAANDSSMEALARAGKQALTDANIRTALARKDFKGVDQRGIDLARQAIEALRDTATNYFEAKPQRAVKLNEFKGAVVPKGIAAESLAILEKNGITVEFYGKTEGAREKAIEKLAKRLDRQSGDVLFSFAGEKSLTHDDLNLAFAQDMVARGQDPEKVRQETGWFQGKDGKWRYEISDKEAFTKGSGTFGEVIMRWYNAGVERTGKQTYKTTVGDVLYHPKLFAAYPALAQIEVQMMPARVRSQGRVMRTVIDGEVVENVIQIQEDLPADKWLSVLLHELQHGIQYIEGFATGGPSGEMMWLGDMRPIAMSEYQKLIFEVRKPLTLEQYAQQAWGTEQVTEAIRDDYTRNFIPSHMKALERQGLDKDLQQTAGWRAYKRLAGEVEARNTQARMGMTDEQRRATPPSATQDVPDADVIVMFDGKVAENAPMPANIRRPGAMTEPMVRQVADTIAARWTQAPTIVVVPNMQDMRVPEAARLEDARQRAAGATGVPRGFYHRGTVYLVADGLKSVSDAAEALFHEALGHYGLRAVFGAELLPILDQIAMARPDLMRPKAEEYGKDLKNLKQRREVAEEVLAEMAQTKPDLGFVKRAIAAIRTWLRQNVPALKDMALTDAEIINSFILPARGWVERGERAMRPGGRVALLRAYHGTPHRGIDKFDTEFIGTGEGNQAYGWGLYFASKREIAEHYRMVLSSGYAPTIVKDGQELNAAADIAEAYYQVGRIYNGYGGLDKVLGFERIDPYRWAVRVQEVGQDGSPKPGARVRSHSTMPDFKDLERVLKADGYDIRRGQLYEVEIPDDSEMLLWDKPLSDQPDGVRAALNNSRWQESSYRKDGAPRNLTGQELYSAFIDEFAKDARQRVRDGEYIANTHSWAQREASLALSAIGIKGIKYLDGSSRADGDGSYNYVIFSGDDVAIQQTFFSRSTLGNQPPQPPQNAWQKLKAKALELTSPESITNLIYELQDKYIDLKNLRDHIKELGGTITDLNDAHLGEELYHKRLAKRTQDFLSEELKPLLADLRARGLDLPTLETFLHASHAPEANRLLAERNPNAQMIEAGKAKAKQDVKALEVQLQRAQAQGTATKAIEQALEQARDELSRWTGVQAFKGTEEERLSLSGMSDQAASDFVANLKPGQKVHLDALAARVDAINAKTLDTLEKYGLIDKATLDAWRNTYQFYVPLHRDEAHPDAVSHPIGQGFSTKGDASKRRTGSNEKVTNILAHIAMQREAALTRGEKNRVAKKLYLMAAQNPDPEVWSVDKPPMSKTVDRETGFVRTGVDPTYKNKPNVVMVRIGGKDHAVVFNERNPTAVRLAQSIKNADVGDLNAFDSIMGKATRWLASVNTQYNPIFGIINFARDVQAAILQLSTTPLKGQERAVAANVPAAMKGIYAEVRSRRKGQGRGQGDWAKLWEEMQDEGGTTGYRDLFIDPKERAEALVKELNKLSRGQASEAAHAVVDWLSDYNETMENAVRLSAYKVALDSGLSKERAASLAKNLTVNFNRRGRQTAKLGAYYAFLNAAIQGTARMVETLRGPAGKKIMLGGVMLGAVNTLIAMTVMGAGEDDDNWEKIPDFVKERSLIVPLGREDYLAIPMPLGFHVLPNMGRKAVEMMLHDDPTKGAGSHVTDMLRLMLDAFNPLGGSENLAQMAMPTPFDPALALIQNRDWTGKPIYREDNSSLDPTPGHTRTKDTASTFSKAVSEALVKITGGTDYQPGAINWTPDQIDFLVGQITGGLGRELMKVEQTLTSPFTGEDLPPHKIPLLGRVYGNTRGPASESEKFYENVTKLNGIEREIKGRARDGVDYEDYMAEEPLAGLLGMGDAAQNEISKLRQYRREVVRQALPGYQDEVKTINEQIGAVMKNVNQEVRRAKQEAMQ